jgi:hypothetical protein
MPVILATQKEEIKRIRFEASPSKYFQRPYLKKTLHTEKELVGWLKV